MSHCYPHDFADQVYRFLTQVPQPHALRPRPDRTTLELLISSCYQASLMREEERPVRFRLILRDPEQFPPSQGPPDGLNRLAFTQPQAFSEDELRRISPAANFDTSLIGVTIDGSGTPWIWGIVHSGSRWLQVFRGGSQKINPLPESLIIFVTGPGRISVSVGSTLIAGLRGGHVVRTDQELFTASWLQHLTSAHRDELWVMHEEARQQATTPWAEISPDFPLILGQNLLRRVISLVRNHRHGGALIIVPTSRTLELKEPNPYLNIKYNFRIDEGRQRIHPQIVRLMNEFARIAGSWPLEGKTVGWNEYVASTDPTLSQLDETLYEMTHLVAELSLIDGAVVLNHRFEVLGFGAEIYSGLDNVPLIQKALDLEGTIREPESPKGMGTRHRSAYRLCMALHDAVVIVVSQDGHVRFVRWHDHAVTCWDQVATGILDF
jgi:DisA bacterial checkpoint controller nucleotide-binding